MQIINKWVGNIDPQEKDKIIDAINLFRDTVSKPEFLEAVRAFKNRKGEPVFTGSNASPGDIANIINKEEITLTVGTYTTLNPWSSVDAKTSNGVVYINRRKINHMSLKYLSGTIAHEWMHVLGFGHTFRDNQDRDDSVPYALGIMVSEWK